VTDAVVTCVHSCDFVIDTTIKTTSVCDGDAQSVDGGRGWPAGDTDGTGRLAGVRR